MRILVLVVLCECSLEDEDADSIGAASEILWIPKHKILDVSRGGTDNYIIILLWTIMWRSFDW